MATSGSITTLEEERYIDSCALFLVNLARQGPRSPSLSPVSQPSTSACDRYAHIMPWDTIIATGTRIHLRQPKPPQPLSRQESMRQTVSESVEQDDRQSLRVAKLARADLVPSKSQHELQNVVQLPERPRHQARSVRRRRRLSGQPPRRARTDELQRPYPNHDTADRRKMIDRLSKGLAVRLASPEPEWSLSYEEGHQIGIEICERKDLEHMLGAGFCARVCKPKDEDRQNYFERSERQVVRYGHPDDRRTWEYQELSNGQRRRVKEIVFRIETEEGLRRTRCGRVVKVTAKAETMTRE